jgi:replicative DNA helicase
VAETPKISRDMRLIAKDIAVPVLALAQLNRACETREDKRPLLADLRESGSIEADADIVAMLYRGEVYDRTWEGLRGRAELLVRKHRGGPTGMVPLVWMANIVRFESAAHRGGPTGMVPLVWMANIVRFESAADGEWGE